MQDSGGLKSVFPLQGELMKVMDPIYIYVYISIC